MVFQLINWICYWQNFFHANNIPFSHAEHTTFEDLVSLLRPGYHVSSRKALDGTLLDEVVAEVEEETVKS